MDLRRKHPFMGKAPIQRMLERKGRRLTMSAVGRILSRAITDGHVPRASVCEGRLQPKRAASSAAGRSAGGTAPGPGAPASSSRSTT